MSPEPAPCPYGLCDGSGFVIDEERGIAVNCRCRPARIAAARVRALEGRIPKRFEGVSFDRAPINEAPPGVVREVRRFTTNIEKNLDHGKGLWFVGDPGTGKTSMAMLISRTAMEAGRTVAVYSLPRLLAVMRDSINSEEGLIGLLDRLTTVDLLHIDDLGSAYRKQRWAEYQRANTAPPESEGYSEWTLEQLYSIVNSRYEDGRSLLLTTNLWPDDLEIQIGEHVVSRIVEMCGEPLPMFGDDKRRELRIA